MSRHAARRAFARAAEHGGDVRRLGDQFRFLPVLAKPLGATNVLQSAIVTTHIVVFALGDFAAAALSPRVGAARLAGVSWPYPSASRFQGNLEPQTSNLELF